MCKAVFLQIRGARQKARTSDLRAFNYHDAHIDPGIKCRDEGRGADWASRAVVFVCFFKRFIELSAWSQAILTLIPGNWRSLGEAKMQ